MARDPDARIVFLTGYSSRAIVGGDNVPVLEKPIRADALLATIAHVLGARAKTEVLEDVDPAPRD